MSPRRWNASPSDLGGDAAEGVGSRRRARGAGRRALFTAIAIAWAGAAIFPVLWMAIMTIKP